MYLKKLSLIGQMYQNFFGCPCKKNFKFSVLHFHYETCYCKPWRFHGNPSRRARARPDIQAEGGPNVQANGSCEHFSTMLGVLKTVVTDPQTQVLKIFLYHLKMDIKYIYSKIGNSVKFTL